MQIIGLIVGLVPVLLCVYAIFHPAINFFRLVSELIIFFVILQFSKSFGRTAHVIMTILFFLYFSYISSGLLVIAIGSIPNYLASFLNNYRMPVDVAADDIVAISEIDEMTTHSVMNSSTRLPWLCDIFWGMSVGDMIITYGLFMFIRQLLIF